MKHAQNIVKHHETLKHSPFDETISLLDVETSALGAATSVLGAATSALAWSFWRYRRRVSGDIGVCGVGITPQMCNRVTNHGDMGTFTKPATGIGDNAAGIGDNAAKMISC